jgi:tRNA(Ile)-lysidine synthase
MGRSTEDGAALERKLLKEVSRLLKELALVHSSQPLIVAVSGGADSLALLLLLAQLRQPLGLDIHVAHLDHGLRGQESLMDARFVEETALRLELPVTLEREDVESFRATHHLSLEAAAREVRYSFLARVAAAQGALAVALGHTADDQAETILMHLLRGSGLDGLMGMQTLSYWPSSRHSHPIALVRPLLGTKREETESLCRWKGFTPRDDSSNLSLHFTRNRIRSDLLPRLRSYNPRFQEALLRLGRSAAQDQAYILGEAVQAREMLAVDTGEGVSIEREGFAVLPPALKRHLLRLIYHQITGSSAGLENCHLEDMVKLSEGRAQKNISLPGGLIFSVEYGSLTLGRGQSKPTAGPALSGEYPLTLSGDTRVPGWNIRANFSMDREYPSHGDAYVAKLDGERVGRHLYVRGRIPGDRFHPLGMAVPKKLQDFMVDVKAPRGVRDRIPLVVSERGIVWVVGYRIAHWARLREDTTTVLSLGFSPDAAT